MTKFKIGSKIISNNNQTYLVEKVEVIRLPPDSPGGQGDIASACGQTG